MDKFISKITSRTVVAPVLYALITMVIFTLVYGLLGYANHFEVKDENKNKNWENSVTASIMLQSNAMGQVVPTTSLGRWLSTAQTALGWMWFLILSAVIL
jgi:hypothetical protein